MKYELGEFTEGKAKGFKYWYPVIELGELDTSESEFVARPYTVPMLNKLCYIFSMSLKQRVAEQVKQKMRPLFEGGASAGLAQLYPDGILNKQETCLTDLLK